LIKIKTTYFFARNTRSLRTKNYNLSSRYAAVEVAKTINYLTLAAWITLDGDFIVFCDMNQRVVLNGVWCLLSVRETAKQVLALDTAE
jgi:hypothetical protein